jgi:hypothetical protein
MDVWSELAGQVTGESVHPRAAVDVA